jgi:hypothetical protein
MKRALFTGAVIGLLAAGAISWSQDRWYAVDGDTVRNLRNGERVAPVAWPRQAECERAGACVR